MQESSRLNLNVVTNSALKALQRNRGKLALMGLALVVLTLFAYWPVHAYDFVYIDDQLYITEYPLVQKGLTWAGLKWAFKFCYAENGGTLTWLSHMMDWQLYGNNAGGHHVTSLIFHLLNTVLLFLWLNRVTRASWRSAFVAALFALHPLHVESVAWVAERKDVLSTFFWMLTLLAYTSYVASFNEDQKIRLRKYGLTLVLFAFGLMAKPMVVTLPFVLLLLDFWPLRRFSIWGKAGAGKVRTSRIVVEKVPFFFLSVVASILAMTVQTGAASHRPKPLPILERIANTFIYYAHYLEKMILPKPLYFYPPPVWTGLQLAGAVVLVALITFVVLRFWKSRPYLVAGWFWFLGTLIPVIGLVPITSQPMADRFTYIPLIGLFLMATWGISDLLQTQRLRVPLSIAALAVIALCVGLTRGQVAHWQNRGTLSEYTFRFSKDDPTLLSNVGALRIEQGRLDEAIALLSQSIAIKPEQLEALNNLAAAFGQQGKHAEARKVYKAVLEMNPKSIEAQFSIGYSLFNEGDFANALPYLATAVKLRPDLANGHELLAEAHDKIANNYLAQGKINEAIPHYEEALSHQPNNAAAQNNLAKALFNVGKLDDARLHAETAARLNPNAPELHYSLFEILLRLGKPAEAEEQIRMAIQFDPNEPVLQNGLGLSLIAQKKWAEAETVFSHALDLAKRIKNQKFAEEISAHLAECRSKSARQVKY